MTIGGDSVILILGLVNFSLIMFQLASGRRWIKVSFKVHRVTGLCLLAGAVVHGLLGILAH